MQQVGWVGVWMGIGGWSGEGTHVFANKSDDTHDAFHDVLVLAGLRLLEGPKEATEQRLQLGRQIRHGKAGFAVILSQQQGASVAPRCPTTASATAGGSGSRT